jgi:excisionase family DNA binding protein
MATATIDEKEESKLLSEPQAAVRCGVSRITLLRMRKAGRIRFYRIGTRVLFSQTHIQEFLASVESKTSGKKTA